MPGILPLIQICLVKQVDHAVALHYNQNVKIFPGFHERANSPTEPFRLL